MICKPFNNIFCTQLIGFKYFYPIKQLHLLLIICLYSVDTSRYNYCYLTNSFIYHNSVILRTVNWFQVLLCISNNSIKHRPFVYTQLNDQTVFLRSKKVGTSSSTPTYAVTSTTTVFPEGRFDMPLNKEF